MLIGQTLTVTWQSEWQQSNLSQVSSSQSNVLILKKQAESGKLSDMEALGSKAKLAATSATFTKANPYDRSNHPNASTS